MLTAAPGGPAGPVAPEGPVAPYKQHKISQSVKDDQNTELVQGNEMITMETHLQYINGYFS